MDVQEIQEVDCGSKFIKEFPNQIKVQGTRNQHSKSLAKYLIGYEGRYTL